MHNLNLQNQQSSNKNSDNSISMKVTEKNAIRTMNECKLQTAMQLYIYRYAANSPFAIITVGRAHFRSSASNEII